jgi:hypothetical protein
MGSGAIRLASDEELPLVLAGNMGLAMLTRRGWRALRSTIRGHTPIPERNVILAAVRDLEDYQRERLEHSRIATIPGPVGPGRFESAQADLQTRVSGVYPSDRARARAIAGEIANGARSQPTSGTG